MTDTITQVPQWCEEVLTTFKQEQGRQWKAKLWDLWLTGQDCYARNKNRESIGATLRQVRNHPDRDAILALVK